MREGKLEKKMRGGNTPIALELNLGDGPHTLHYVILEYIEYIRVH